MELPDETTRHAATALLEVLPVRVAGANERARLATRCRFSGSDRT